MTVHLHKESNKINIMRGVQHGDTILLKLFTATLESIFLENQRPEDSEYLSHLRVVDNTLCANTPHELYIRIQQIVQEIAGENEN